MQTPCENGDYEDGEDKTDNLKDKVLEAAGGEEIEAVVFRAGYLVTGPIEPISWAEAAPLLDYYYAPRYGGGHYGSLVAWTASRVIFIRTYDGATTIDWLPRRPIAFTPEQVGGGYLRDMP